MKKVRDFEDGKRAVVVGEYLAGGTTYRRLSRKYGVPRTTINRWVETVGGEGLRDEEAGGEREERGESAEESRLRKELEKSRLENKLLNAMIDIAEEQLGVDIRKKRGARR